MNSLSSEPVLRLSKVCRSYGLGDRRLDVLVDADLQIQAGEMVSLIAPSGAGKSTLLHASGLLEKPDSGEVFIHGSATRDLGDDGRTVLRRTAIGFIYQFHHLLPEFSALENLMIPQMIAGLNRDEARDRATQLLDYMKIGDRCDHRPAELSGGEQQRVAIARAVTNGPKLLLADEPTGNLDPETAGHVFGMLRNLVRSSRLAALIATHNHELAGQMDRCVTLEGGKIIEIKG